MELPLAAANDYSRINLFKLLLLDALPDNQLALKRTSTSVINDRRRRSIASKVGGHDATSTICERHEKLLILHSCASDIRLLAP